MTRLNYLSVRRVCTAWLTPMALALTLQSSPAVGQTTDSTLTVRARATLYSNVGPVMSVRIDGVQVGQIEVRSATFADHPFKVTNLRAGAKVDVVFTNDAAGGGSDRNLYIAYLKAGDISLTPTALGSTYDRGAGAKAFDGIDVIPGQGEMYWGGALRMTWPQSGTTPPPTARQLDAVRLLQQATFGPTKESLDSLAATTNAAWIDQQIAMPWSPSYVPYIEAKYALGESYRPRGDNYSTSWNAHRFWAQAATAKDQLRRRVGFALHEIFVISTTDSSLHHHTRAYANYLDLLDKHALGNFRTLIEEMALSPAMGIYLSHIRNRPEDPATGRLPDENFARELMQLFTIGLHELNADGTLQLGADGKPIETYSNADVMAMAKVFTGYSWGFPDNELTNQNFRRGGLDYSAANDRRIDLQRMKNYPGQYSAAEKRLFVGKPWAVTIPANGTAQNDLRIALDTLFRHPNVGPFIGRQLIQRLVTSHPSPAYVGRVAAAFNNNGRGVRGDLAAVVRAILLDPEARGTATNAASAAKLREPVLRVTHWMRAMGARSASGEYLVTRDLDPLSQRVFAPVSVFSYFRPGYIPAGTALAAAGATAPEFQIVNEGTTAAWVNLSSALAGNGIGWTGSTQDLVSPMTTPIALASAGNINGLIEHLNLMLFAGRMSPELKTDILEAVSGVSGSDAASQSSRARTALFIALASPEYLVQR